MSREDSAAKLQRAMAAAEEGDYDTAVALAEEVCDADASSVEARLLLGEIALDEADFEACLAFADEALEIDPEDREAQLLAAEASLMLEDLLRVVGICEEILKVDPSDTRARHLMAEAILDLGEATEAAALFETLLEEDEDHVDAWMGLAIARYELGQYPVSLDCLKEVRRLMGEDVADVFFHIGLNLERLDDEKGAKRAFARAQELAPDQYPPPLLITLDEFGAIVEDVMESLPEKLRGFMGNVPISVEEIPSEDDLKASDPPLSPRIWGLFRGSSILENHPEVISSSQLPSEIVLYRRNLERGCADKEELTEEIRVTLLHEIGHYLGWDEDEVAAHGLA